MKTEKRQKYFVNQKEAVTIQCLACGRVGNFSVASLKNKKHSIKINCPCAEIFEVDLEFRQDYRQKTHLSGSIRALSTPKERARHCIIADQSNGGLLLHVTDEVPINNNDTLIVSYRPDSNSLQEIEKMISVRHYAQGHHIGGAFIDPHPQRNARPLLRHYTEPSSSQKNR